MKRKSLLFVAMLLACVMSASARTVKTNLDLSKATAVTDYGTQWSLDTKTLNALGELGWTFEPTLDITQYDRLVVKLKENNMQCNWGIQFRLTADGSQNYVENINDGKTLCILYIDEIIDCNDGTQDGKDKTLDKTAVSRIYFWGGDYQSGQIVIDEIYFEKDITDYDEVLDVPQFTKEAFDLGEMTECLDWGGSASYDKETQKLNFSEDDGMNYRLGFKDLEYNTSEYSKLVLKVRVISTGWHTLHLYISDNGEYGKYLQAIQTSDNIHTIEIPFEELMTNDDNGENEPRAINTIKEISFWTMTATEAIVTDLYLEKPNGSLTCLVRENTAADAYKTICLPFAAAKPENATIYDVVGVDSKDNPSKLYLEAVETLEAGKAYVVKSDDDEDITFTKTGDDEDLTVPSTDGNMVGVFGETEYVPTGSYILSGGQWKKVVNESSNTVANYRAYLTLTDALVVTEEASDAKYAVMQIEGGTTGINTIEDAAMSEGAIYNLNGVRVQKPAKGLYIKNGKKYIVK